MNSEGIGIGTSGSGQTSGRVRIYELAKELGLQNKDMVTKIRTLGIEAKNHMSSLDVEDVARVKRALDKERQENIVQERLTATVIRRRTKDGTAVRTARPADEKAEKPRLAAEAPAAAPPEPPPAEVEGEPSPEAPPAEAAPATPTIPDLQPVHAEPPAEPTIPDLQPVRAPEPPAETTIPDLQPVRAPEPSVEASAEAKPAEGAAAEAKPEPKKPEPVKFGPTGRVIELPSMRQPIIQVTERDTRGRPARDLSQKRDLSGRDRFGRQQQAKKRAPAAGKKQKTTLITTPAAHKRVIKLEETIAVAEIAKQMSVKATDVLKKLWSMGMTGITLNSTIDADTAGLVASEFGFEIENVAFQEKDIFQQAEDAEEDLELRAPVVTIMGHVDHGKTSLLDAIRNANVAAGEAGGITQHIGAYKVQTPSGNDVVFLDTPGHEAFTAMRARGAQVTDIVVLVVAADDGVMPQTVEAIQHSKSAEVPIIVAVNKIDKSNAQPERIRQQLSAHGLTPEGWGGETIYVDVSARNKTGVDTLLEMIGLQAEVLELKANPNKLARGHVVEAKLDRNRGPVATVLIQDGTLKSGDTVVAGEFMGKVRAMLDDKGRQLGQAGPATPVEVLGLSGVPNAGETFNAVTDEKAAKELVEHRRDARRKKELSTTTKVSLENILERIREGSAKELRIVLKADVQGSAEAVRDALINLTNEQVKVDVIASGVGGITESDVNLAKAGAAIIVGFHVRPAGKATQLAEQEQVDIKLYDIIYEALDDVKKAMAGLLAPVRREKALGQAEVRQLFTIPKIGTIAGCSITSGLIRRSAQVRLVRDSVPVMTGKISSLRRFKEDVREVTQGYECGIGIENYNDLKIGDVIEAFDVEEVAPTLA